LTIEWTVFAMIDREDIFDTIAADSKRNAVAVDDRIESQVDLLIDTPEIGRLGRISGTRELVIQRAPYIVAYKIEEEAIVILRVLHGARQWPSSLEPNRDE
jgi:toxin ParE1/3/4